MVDIVDVGGGFPSVYPGMIPPDMSDYVDSIQRGFAEMSVHEETELWCEPGRALVAEASSVLAKVELKKGDALYLNDGSYGSLFDAAHLNFNFPVKLVSRPVEAREPFTDFVLWGPTCDTVDHMKGPFRLPDKIREGDYIEFGNTGAYGRAIASRFNGFGAFDEAILLDEPMFTMYARERVEQQEAEQVQA
jgi:ornithine decarboxylase